MKKIIVSAIVLGGLLGAASTTKAAGLAFGFSLDHGRVAGEIVSPRLLPPPPVRVYTAPAPVYCEPAPVVCEPGVRVEVPAPVYAEAPCAVPTHVPVDYRVDTHAISHQIKLERHIEHHEREVARKETHRELQLDKHGYGR